MEFRGRFGEWEWGGGMKRAGDGRGIKGGE